MTEIDGAVAQAAPGVLDRGRRAAHLDRRRAVALGAWFVVPDGLVRVTVEGLAGANLLIGVLNLVPGLPLDGGRVLKAGGVGRLRQPAPRHARRRLGRAADRARRC